MDFTELETKVRTLIGGNKISESIALLNSFFKDEADLNQIALQSAKYHTIMEKKVDGTADHLEVDLALSQVRANVLQFLSSKSEYFKFKEETFGEATQKNGSNNGQIKVFFSVASPHNEDQQNYINRLKEYFIENGIQLQTLTEWEDNDPLIPILKELKDSCGCLVLALERYYIQEGTAKRGSDQESSLAKEAFTSPWLQIEAALARSLDLPLIILKDKALTNEGLIHNDKQEWGIVRINQDDIEEIREYPVKNFILNWINQVKKYSAS
ncbi:MAG: hypothetical protein AB3N14_10830 [Flavobacteriaceae bacterium]